MSSDQPSDSMQPGKSCCSFFVRMRTEIMWWTSSGGSKESSGPSLRGQELVIDGNILFDHGLPTVRQRGGASKFLHHRNPGGRNRAESPNRSQIGGVAIKRDERSVLTRHNKAVQRGQVTAYHHESRCHGFDDTETESLIFACCYEHCVSREFR